MSHINIAELYQELGVITEQLSYNKEQNRQLKTRKLEIIQFLKELNIDGTFSTADTDNSFCQEDTNKSS